MQRPPRSAPLRYGGALAAVALAIAARLALDPLLGDKYPFATLFLAVLVVAGYGGRGPAVLATVLGAVVSGGILLPPRGEFAIGEVANQAGMVLYLVVGLGIALLGGFMRDARRRAEGDADEAVRQRERLRTILASIGDAVLVTDAEGRVASLNPVAEALTGWTSAEAAGRPLPAVVRLVYEATRREVEDPARRALREGAIVAQADPTVLIARDGSERAIDDTAAPIRGGDGISGAVLVFRDVTGRRQGERVVAESERRLRMALDAARMVAWEWDPADGSLRVSENAADVFGLPRGTTLLHIEQGLNLVHPDDLASYQEAFRKAIEECGSYLIHYRLVRPDDGAVLWMEERGHAVCDDSGRVRRLTGVVMDITERKRAELGVQRSEERFRLLADAMPQLVWVTRPDRSVEYVNRRWLDYTGQKPGECLGPADWAAAIHPDDLARVNEASVRSHATGAPFEAEYRVRDASGAYRWHLGRAVPICDEAGRVVRRFGSATDIDDRKRAERDARFLAEASATLAGIVDEAAALQKVADLAIPFFADWCSVDLAEEGGPIRRLAVAHVDPAKVELAHELHRRYPPAPDAEAGIPAVIRSGESRLIAEITDEMIVAGARDEDHLRILRGLALASYMCVPLRGRSRTLGAISFVAAESGRRYGPDDLRIAEDLASRAAIAIENARLYGALKEADRRKDEFLATLAHELRNPLASIRNALHLIRADGADGPMESERAMAERNVVHLARLIDDLMDVARINRGRIELNPRVVDLATVVAHAVETARPLIDERRHELIVTVAEGPTRLEADPTRLEQVLWNLLNNAAKYTEPGGRIRLSVEPDGKAVAVRVRDTGIGIDAAMLPRVFDMFVQVGEHRGHAQGGLGIGLSLVRTLVEMHGGTIVARSGGPGNGSEFVIRLPLLAPSGEVEGPANGSRLAAAERPPRRRILVVDDNVDAARSLARLLERLHGQEVRVAHDGPEALGIAREFLPEVVVLDIGLPGMDGNEVARRLRQRPESRGALLVALTGWGQEADVERSRAAGFDRHLVKPADPAAILEVLATAGKGGP